MLTCTLCVSRLQTEKSNAHTHSEQSCCNSTCHTSTQQPVEGTTAPGNTWMCLSRLLQPPKEFLKSWVTNGDAVIVTFNPRRGCYLCQVKSFFFFLCLTGRPCEGAWSRRKKIWRSSLDKVSCCSTKTRLLLFFIWTIQTSDCGGQTTSVHVIIPESYYIIDGLLAYFGVHILLATHTVSFDYFSLSLQIRWTT